MFTLYQSGAEDLGVNNEENGVWPNCFSTNPGVVNCTFLLKDLNSDHLARRGFLNLGTLDDLGHTLYIVGVSPVLYQSFTASLPSTQEVFPSPGCNKQKLSS